MTVIIAIDAMGGDRAPDIVIEGAAIVAAQDPSVRFLLFGVEDRLAPLLDNQPTLKAVSEVIHTDQVITGDMKPTLAIRQLRRSSMRLAIEAVSQKRAHAVVSAGNTGAYMALSKIILKSIPGIDRPAIATSILSKKGRTIVLDLGANVDVNADNLYQFALMGHAFARRALGKEHPTIGLLNVGVEELKGNATVQEAALCLRKNTDLNFYGFVEGDDIMAGTTDVVVTDGFSGNIALKAMEGTARLVKDLLVTSFSSSWRGKLGYLIARPALKKMQATIDPRAYNGAAFLGVQGISIKSHGGTDAVGFANAIRVAIHMAKDSGHGTLIQDIHQMMVDGSSDKNTTEEPSKESSADITQTEEK